MSRFVEVEGKSGLFLPDKGKAEGGTYFDDELESVAKHREEFNLEMSRLIEHLNQRPDHDILVGSIKDREEMRTVFNAWKRNGVIGHNPNIRIEYGVPDGTIRVGDGR